MNTTLRISPDLGFPVDIVTDTIGVLAVKGSGKTYTALVLLEQMVAAGLPVVAIDPVGVFWGLRTSADGQGPGLPVVILGGSHGDVPLEQAAGRVVADFVIGERQPTVLDFSSFESKEEQHRFTREFLERLYEANREALHVFIDEADDIAPQKPFGEEARLLRAVEVLVRRGRARGLGCTLITQRAAVLHKNVLTQVSTLVVGRTVAPQDRKAIEAWIAVHGVPEQKAALLQSLATLPTREKWIWSPERGIFARVPIAARLTFDSSATPKVGMTRLEPKPMAAVDLQQLRTRIAGTVGGPKRGEELRLHERIAEVAEQVVEAERTLRLLRPAHGRRQPFAGEHAASLDASAKSMRAAAEGILRHLHEGPSAPGAGTEPRATPTTYASTPSAPAPSTRPELGRCEMALLRGLAQRSPQPTTRAQLAVLSGYSSASSGFARSLAELRRRALVDGAPNALLATPSGLTTIGPMDPLPQGRALAQYWESKLARCEGAILRALVQAYPGELSRDELARLTGYSPQSSGFARALAKLRTLQLVDDLRVDALLADVVPPRAASMPRPSASTIGEEARHV